MEKISCVKGKRNFSSSKSNAQKNYNVGKAFAKIAEATPGIFGQYEIDPETKKHALENQPKTEVT